MKIKEHLSQYEIYHLNMVGVDNFPFKVQGFHCSVDFTHNIMWFALTSDSKMPFASFDRSSTMSFQVRSHGFVSQRSHDSFRMGSDGFLTKRTWRSREKLLEVILLFSCLDSLVVNDQVVCNDKLVVRIITQQGRMYFLFLNTKLLTHLERETERLNTHITTY